MGEDVDVDFDEGKVEEDDEEVEPQDVVKLVYEPKESYLPFVFVHLLYFVKLVNLARTHHLTHLLVAKLEMARTLLGIELCLNDLIVLLLFEPVPQKPDNYSKDEDAKKDNHPSELVREKIGSFFEDSVFSKYVLSI